MRPARPLAPIAVAVASSASGGWWRTTAAPDGCRCSATWSSGRPGGIVGPAVVLARAKVRVVSAPTDGTAGLPRGAPARSLDPAAGAAGGAGRDGGLRRAGREAPPDGGRVTLLPQRRGVHDSVTLDIASAAPFALQWWTRRVVLPLPSTAPRGTPPRPARSRCRGGPRHAGGDRTTRRHDRRRASPEAPAPTGRATTGVTSTGGPRPTPES